MEITVSECKFPLHQLPALIIENIARYLSNKDLAACCALSRGVREAFDDELVWKPRYDADRVKYLLQTPCKVEPGFLCPETSNTSLSPMSEWRVAFMAENHLWNNWRQGKFKEEDIKTSSDPSPHDWYNNHSLYHEFLSNDYVIAGFHGRIEILDVRYYPATIAIGPIPSPNYKSQKNVKVNEFILFVCTSAVQVIKLNFLTKQWNFEHAFILDEPEKICDEKKDVFYNYVDKRNKMVFEVVQPFFVGCLEGDSKMHIWNFETGVKLKTEKCPVKNVTIQAFKSSSLNLILSVKQKESNTSIFLVYDLSKTVFLPFNEPVQGSYQYCVFGHCVAIWADKYLNIYNYHKCKKILSNYSLEFCELKIIGKNIIFLQGNALKLFNQVTMGIETLKVGVRWFEILSNKFIQVELVNSHNQGWGRREGVFELDSSGNLRTTSLHLDFRSCGYYLNKSATRYIVRYADGHVINFW